MVRSFDAPILRYFFLWMIGLISLYIITVKLMNGGSMPLNPVAGDLLTQVIAFLPFFYFLFKSMNRSMPLRYYVRPHIASAGWIEIVLVALVWILFSIGVDGLFGYGLSWLAPNYVVDSVSLKLFDSGTATPVVMLTVLLAGIVAPVMEELVFRGLIFQRLIVKIGVVRAVVISSLLFGLLHLEGWLGASIFATLMCILYLQTKNILVPIALHVLNNLFSLFLEYIFRAQEAITDIRLIREELAWSMLCLLTVPWVIKSIRKYWPKGVVNLPYYHNQSNLT